MKKSIEDYRKLSYEVRVINKGGLFVLYIPELGCFSEGATLEKAYEQLLAEKEKFFEKICRMDLHGLVIAPGHKESHPGKGTLTTPKKNINPALTSYLIITLSIIIFAWSINYLIKKNANELWARFKLKIQNTYVELKENPDLHRDNLHSILLALSPYADELREHLNKPEHAPKKQ